MCLSTFLLHVTCPQICPRLSFYLDAQVGWHGHYISVRRCGGLPMVLLQLKELLELFVKRREFLSGSGFLSRRDMA